MNLSLICACVGGLGLLECTLSTMKPNEVVVLSAGVLKCKHEEKA